MIKLDKNQSENVEDLRYVTPCSGFDQFNRRVIHIIKLILVALDYLVVLGDRVRVVQDAFVIPDAAAALFRADEEFDLRHMYILALLW